MKTLSICISTYNRAEKILKLVNTLLSIHDNRFDVIVSDDYSTDDTIERLKKINDDRLKIFRNEYNMGPKENWFYTIDRGDGKYLLHILDRDMINICYIEDIISVLEDSEVGYGYIGAYASGSYNDKSTISECIYHEGVEAMLEFGGTLVHPTGFFVKKECWDSIEDKYFFFSEKFASIYPHSYIYMRLAEKEKGLALRWNAFDIDNYSNIGRYKSAFYNKERSDYWWLPQARINEFFCFAKYISASDIQRNLCVAILVNRFRTNLDNVTIDYLFLAMDEKNSRHYGYKKIRIDMETLIDISQNFTNSFICFLGVQEDLEDGTLESVIKIRDANIDNIKRQYDFSDKMMRYDKLFTLMDAWLGLELQGICLADKLMEKGIRDIAIYGNGKLGKKLYMELERKINVVYFIDKRADSMREKIPVLHIEDEIPPIDLIIVSVPEYYEKIREQFLQKGISNVASIEDVVYDCYV